MEEEYPFTDVVAAHFPYCVLLRNLTTPTCNELNRWMVVNVSKRAFFYEETGEFDVGCSWFRTPYLFREEYWFKKEADAVLFKLRFDR